MVLEIDIGKGVRALDINPKRITLGFLEDIEEAQATGGWKPLISAITALCGFTRDETRQLTVDQFGQIATALREAIAAETKIPNE